MQDAKEIKKKAINALADAQFGLGRLVAPETTSGPFLEAGSRFGYELDDVEVLRFFMSKSEGTSDGGGFGGR